MPVPNLGFVVDYFSAPVGLKRYPAGRTTDANFRRVSGDAVSSTIRAHCFPTPGKKIERLPEGHEEGASIEIHTTEPLVVGSSITDQRGDVVTWNGDDYEVDVAGDRTAGSTSHATANTSRTFGVYFAKLVRRETSP